MLNLEVARGVNQLYLFGFDFWGDVEYEKGEAIVYTRRFKTGLTNEDALYQLRVFDKQCYGVLCYNGKEKVKFRTNKGFFEGARRAVEDCAILRQNFDKATQEIVEKNLI